MPRSFWVGSSLLIGILGLACLIALVAAKQSRLSSLPVISPVADFTLTNETGRVTPCRK